METLNIYLAGGMQKFGKKDFNESNYWRVHKVAQYYIRGRKKCAIVFLLILTILLVM